MLLLISGPSGSGKTPLLYRVLETFPIFSKIQSYTTRKNRKKEVQGTYVYLTHEQFEKKIKENFFFEYSKVHKDQEYYGMSRDSYEKIVGDGKVPIKDIDVDSFKRLKEANELDIVGIYITVQNRGILFDRLRERGESERTINLRLHDRVDYENSFSKYYDHVVYTDDFEKAYKQVCKIISDEFKKRDIKCKKCKPSGKYEHMF